ncbi:hypothetical protein B0H11DRAFT_2260743 [Mycena galericulata]|nr:hypothetical protein B0H11DRAFT_2260743 [Mycena galericulata]
MPFTENGEENLVEITQKPRVVYDPNRYDIGIRTREEIEPHLQLLREYVQTCPIETHENVGFMIDLVSD